MRIEIHKEQSSPPIYIAGHASNGAVLGTGGSPETALLNVLKSVRAAYADNRMPAQAAVVQKCIDACIR